MIKVTVSGTDEVKRIVADLENFARRGYEATVERGAKKLAEAVKDDIRAGSEDGNSPMAPLALSTLEGPVHRVHNPAKRSLYGNTPLVATGALVNDIDAIKLNSNEFEITARSDLGQMKLSSNARSSHSGSPYAGDTPKPVRDPLQVTDKRIDIIFDTIVAELERVIGN